MSQYEARLERDLGRIRDKLAGLTEAVQTALKTATQAMFAGDHERSYGVCLDDHPINRASRELDRTCHGFIAVHLPTAGHLRFVSAVMHSNIELERIGDYAKTISRESVQFEHPPSGAIREHLEQVSGEAQRVLHQAVNSFTKGDAEAAREGIAVANDVASLISAGFSVLVEGGQAASVRELLGHVVVLNCLDRVADQAKNICEETIFAVTGQTKAAKSYRVLFLDADNSVLGPMAQALAQRNHPQSGQYSSAGRQAAASFQEGLQAFLSERGVELATAAPQALDPTLNLSGYHAIVSLQGSVRDYIDKVPYSTIALRWDVGAPPSSGPVPGTSEETSARLETLFRTLAPQLRDLMVTLHGEEKS